MAVDLSKTRRGKPRKPGPREPMWKETPRAKNADRVRRAEKDDLETTIWAGKTMYRCPNCGEPCRTKAKAKHHCEKQW